MALIIGVGGRMGSGKDTFGDILVEKGFERRAFADPVKEEINAALKEGIIPDDLPERGQDAMLCCLALGDLDAFAKPISPDMRALLQAWGTDYRRAQDPLYWVKKVAETIEPGKNYVVTDVRFLSEMHWVQGLGGHVVLVKRNLPDTEGLDHISEHLYRQEHLFDFTVYNNSTLDNLRAQALAITNYLDARAAA